MKTFKAQHGETSAYFSILKIKKPLFSLNLLAFRLAEAPIGVGLSPYKAVVVKTVLSLNG